MSYFESGFLADIVNSKLNISLVCVCCYLAYKIIKPKFQKPAEIIPKLERLKVRDYNLTDLLKYNDCKETQNRILVAVKGKVFDVSNGRRFYGKGGPYGVFAGRDASRALATFSLEENESNDDPTAYDDLSDLTPEQLEGVTEWQLQFKEKYDYVGNLVREGAETTDYSVLDDFGDVKKPKKLSEDGDSEKIKDD